MLLATSEFPMPRRLMHCQRAQKESVNLQDHACQQRDLALEIGSIANATSILRLISSVIRDQYYLIDIAVGIGIQQHS